MGLNPGMQWWFNIRKSINVKHRINKMKDKNHNILNKEKAFVKNSTYSQDKKKDPLNKMGIERMQFNIIKVIYDQATVNMILNSEKLKAFPLRSGKRLWWPLLWLLVNTVLEVLARAIQFSSVAQSCPTLCNPMNRSMPGLPVHHQLPESTQTNAHWVGDGIQPSHPLSSPSPALNLSQHQGLFKWVSSLHQVAKV